MCLIGRFMSKLLSCPQFWLHVDSKFWPCIVIYSSLTLKYSCGSEKTAKARVSLRRGVKKREPKTVPVYIVFITFII